MLHMALLSTKVLFICSHLTNSAFDELACSCKSINNKQIWVFSGWYNVINSSSYTNMWIWHLQVHDDEAQNLEA